MEKVMATEKQEHNIIKDCEGTSEVASAGVSRAGGDAACAKEDGKSITEAEIETFHGDENVSRSQPALVAVDGIEPLHRLSSDIAENGESSAIVGGEVLAHRDLDEEAHSADSTRGISSDDRMIRAELVAPPVQALRVSIDEETPNFQPSQRTLPSTPEKRRLGFNILWSASARRKALIGIVAATIVIASISIVIPLNRRSSSLGDMNMTEPSTAPTFPFECYTSTLDILKAQVELTEIPEAFVICPNTTIEVGIIENPAGNVFSMVNGDHPITAIRENVVIQCGLDGRRENNCVLSGGFIHVLTLIGIPSPEGDGTLLMVTKRLDNFTVRGITFTGQLGTSGPFNGISLSISHPAKNVRFEDCLWTDMIANVGVIEVLRNGYLTLTNGPLEDGTIDVTFSDCSFRNIVFGHPVIIVENQNVTLERCDFRHMEAAFLVGPCEHGNSISLVDGCAGLLYCFGSSMCSFADICIEDMEIEAPALILYDDSTVLKVQGTNYLSDTNVPCEMATAYPDGGNYSFNCSTIFEASKCSISSATDV